MKNSIYIKILFALIFVLALSQNTTAQISLPNGDSTEVDDTGAGPIDGLIGLGIVAGAALGYKKLRKK
ncbi:MAG: hypothetical protein CL868_18205 [Cytophagaceae bacterium]|nr:hypothetical protein [Cytophagaceae bacterium]|tara:strand:- start:25 stop:228 length:204 start_codon:yes stop_codon:yes gene_type:complete